MPNITAGLIIIFLMFIIFYWLTSKKLVINNWLLFTFGIIFYSWGDIKRGLFLIALIGFDHAILKTFINKNNLKKAGLIIVLFVNISIWLFFRYFENNIFDMRFSGISLGMSFYILRKISYFFAVYKDDNFTQDSFLEYGLYVSFFPQILSGPIENPKDFVHLLARPRELKNVNYYDSFTLILLGLFKKMVIADNLRVIVDRVFQLSIPPFMLVYVGSIAFYIQLFCDLSGYTDLSRGFAGLIGFRTSKNFNNPFFSKTTQDFWSRWHITLSNWLRTIIFFPTRRYFLRKKTSNAAAILIPTLLTLIVSGYWHGKELKYIIWGGYHGILMLTFFILKVDKWIKKKKRLTRFGIWFINFHMILFGWMIFRSSGLGWVLNVCMSINHAISYEDLVVTLSVASQIILFISLLFIHYLINQNNKLSKIADPLFFAAVAVILIVFSTSGFQEFIYFGF